MPATPTRLSIDVTDLVEELRPYATRTPAQTPLRAYKDTPARIFSSPLEPHPHTDRRKPTADEAARELLANDPYLRLCSPAVKPQESPVPMRRELPEADIAKADESQAVSRRQPQLQVSAGARAPPRYSASFSAPHLESSPPYSPVLPNQPALTSDADSPSTTPAKPSLLSQTPVSAARPPRPHNVPRLPPLNAPTPSPSQSGPHPFNTPRSGTPTTPFQSSIPLTYSAVKTPGAAPLPFSDSPSPRPVPGEADPPSSAVVASFFRSRSAHVSSPIFSARPRRMGCEDLGTPDVRVNPLATTREEAACVPEGIIPSRIVDMEFSLHYGFDCSEDVDLSYRANRVPLPYAVRVRTTELDGGIKPVFARIERDSDSTHTMLVEVITSKAPFRPMGDDMPAPGHHAEAGDNDCPQEATLTFWAAPDTFCQFGTARLLLTVTDEEDIVHETKIELHIIGTAPVIAVEARGNPPEPDRKETTVTFERGSSRCPLEENVTVWNQTAHGAPVLVNAVVTDAASGVFTLGKRSEQVDECIPMVIPAGQSCSFKARFELLPDITLRGCYYGCALIKLASLFPAKELYPGHDEELHQFYDHVLNFQASCSGAGYTEKLSCIEDPTANNIEELFEEHNHCNPEGECHPPEPCLVYSPGLELKSLTEEERRQEQEEENDITEEYPLRGPTEVTGRLSRLSLHVSPESKEPLPEDLQNKPYLVCEYSMDEPPLWVPGVDPLVGAEGDNDEDSCPPLNGTDVAEQDENSPRHLSSPDENAKREHSARTSTDSSLHDNRANSSRDDDHSLHKEDVTERTNEDEDGGLSESVALSSPEVSQTNENSCTGETHCTIESTHDGNYRETSEVQPGSVWSDNGGASSEIQSYLRHHSDVQESQVNDCNVRTTDMCIAENWQSTVPGKSSNLELSSFQDTTEAPGASVLCPVVADKLDLQNDDGVCGTPAYDASGQAEKPHLEDSKVYRKPPLPPASAQEEVQEASDSARSIFTNSPVPRSTAQVKLQNPHITSLSGFKTFLLGTHRQGALDRWASHVSKQKEGKRHLQTNTSFRSSMNDSDLAVGKGRQLSASTVGSFASVNPDGKTTLRDFPALFHTKRKIDGSKPKLKMPRKVLDNGLKISSGATSTVLPVCNASPVMVQVRVSVREGFVQRNFVAKSTPAIHTPFAVIRPQQRVDLSLTRANAEGGHFEVVLECSALNVPHSASVTYQVPLDVEAAEKSIPTIQGFAVDRPTLSFYNPSESNRRCRVRVLNATRRRVSFKVWIGNKNHPPICRDGRPVFQLMSPTRGFVAPQDCLSILVTYNGGSGVCYFKERLYISVGRRVDYIPMFGYSGASDLSFCLTEDGHVKVKNDGLRYGFLVLSGPETDSPENVMTKAILRPNETRDFVAPYGSGTLIYSGDEIARTRMCKAQDLFPPEGADRFDESSLFTGSFEGQEEAAQRESLSWQSENKHTLHYAGRLLDGNVRKYAFDSDAQRIVSLSASCRDSELSWDASVDETGYVHIENYDAKEVLCFTAQGAEPRVGTVPPLGDAMLATFSDHVSIRARGSVREMETFRAVHPDSF